MTRGGGSAARFSIPMNLGVNLGLHGFAHLGSTSNNKGVAVFWRTKGSFEHDSDSGLNLIGRQTC
jgi:hypothetical protein